MKGKKSLFGSCLVCFGGGLLLALLCPVRLILILLAAILFMTGMALLRNC
ncbi:MAG: hypothetical protein IKI50_08160 [Clostridia bacterium]|nr:hypothetical protein [Clostridia bacterium]